jgi:hypothetical protein
LSPACICCHASDACKKTLKVIASKNLHTSLLAGRGGLGEAHLDIWIYVYIYIYT